jgi:uncharacterized damage-inducible protein DinB
MDPRIAPLAELLRLNVRLFRNCLDGLSEAAARVRPSDSTNSASYVAGHMVESRYYMLKLLGAEQANPLRGFTGEWKGIADIAEWPSLQDISAGMTTAAEALDRRLASITTAELDAKVDPWFEGVTGSTFGMLNFLMQHDSYHLGQLSLLRKYAGLPAMKYS